MSAISFKIVISFKIAQYATQINKERAAETGNRSEKCNIASDL